RSRLDRRRQWLATILAHHTAADHASGVLQYYPVADRLLPVLHPGIRRLQRTGWSGRLDAALLAVSLPAGFPAVEHGLCFGHGLGAADRHRPGDRPVVLVLSLLGVLGRPLEPTMQR